jgi:hypothetical protein
VLEPTSAKRQVNKRAIRVGRQLTRPHSARSAAAQRLKPSARGRLRELITKELPTCQYAHIFRKDLLITFIVSVSNVGRHHNGKSIGVFAKREQYCYYLISFPCHIFFFVFVEHRANERSSFFSSKQSAGTASPLSANLRQQPKRPTHHTNKKSRDISHPRGKTMPEASS